MRIVKNVHLSSRSFWGMYLLCAKSAEGFSNSLVLDGARGISGTTLFWGGNNSPAVALECRGTVALGGRLLRRIHHFGHQHCGLVFLIRSAPWRGGKGALGKNKQLIRARVPGPAFMPRDPAGRPDLGDEILHHLAMDIGEPEMPALEFEGELLMVDAE